MPGAQRKLHLLRRRGRPVAALLPAITGWVRRPSPHSPSASTAGSGERGAGVGLGAEEGRGGARVEGWRRVRPGGAGGVSRWRTARQEVGRQRRTAGRSIGRRDIRRDPQRGRRGREGGPWIPR